MRTAFQIFTLAFLILSVPSFAQLKEISINDLENNQKQNPRNAVLFFYTDWCQYCKAMRKTTFRNSEVIGIINEKFYFVPFNAEERNDVVFNGKTYRYQPTGRNIGLNEFTQLFSKGKSVDSYPQLVILDSNNEVILLLGGYINRSEMLKILEEFKNISR